jgi:hypothetical protein
MWNSVRLLGPEYTIMRVRGERRRIGRIWRRK